MFAVRFHAPQLGTKLLGRFTTASKARWWATLECDGHPFTIVEIA